MYEYRCFLIFALLNFAESADLVSGLLCRADISRYCRPTKARYYGPPHNYYHGNGQIETGTPDKPIVQPLPPANTFEDLAQNLATAESTIRKYCSNISNGNIKEVYGEDTYILKYTLRNFKESDIKVKIKHTVIYVTANQAGLKSFEDLRILPNILNMRLASWALENNYLKVVIPYNVPFRRETMKECGNVNDATIEVPSMKSNLVPRLNRFQQSIKKQNVLTSTTQPDISNSKESDAITVDEALSIISPPDYENFDVRNYQV